METRANAGKSFCCVLGDHPWVLLGLQASSASCLGLQSRLCLLCPAVPQATRAAIPTAATVLLTIRTRELHELRASQLTAAVRLGQTAPTAATRMEHNRPSS